MTTYTRIGIPNELKDIFIDDIQKDDKFWAWVDKYEIDNKVQFVQLIFIPGVIKPFFVFRTI
jgi:hypothetical protein